MFLFSEWFGGIIASFVLYYRQVTHVVMLSDVELLDFALSTVDKVFLYVGCVRVIAECCNTLEDSSNTHLIHFWANIWWKQFQYSRICNAIWYSVTYLQSLGTVNLINYRASQKKVPTFVLLISRLPKPPENIFQQPILCRIQI